MKAKACWIDNQSGHSNGIAVVTPGMNESALRVTILSDNWNMPEYYSRNCQSQASHLTWNRTDRANEHSYSDNRNSEQYVWSFWMHGNHDAIGRPDWGRLHQWLFGTSSCIISSPCGHVTFRHTHISRRTGNRVLSFQHDVKRADNGSAR